MTLYATGKVGEAGRGAVLVRGREYVRKRPSTKTLEAWYDRGGCKTPVCGCWVEPDGQCEHGRKSWLEVVGYI